MQCPKCKSPMHAHLEITGGCQGHGPDEYCYCNSLDAHVTFVCTKSKCRKAVTHPILSCMDSIDRWLTANFKE